MCNLQSNLKLNERKRGNSSDRERFCQRGLEARETKGRRGAKDKGEDRAITRWKEREEDEENASVESPWHPYSLLSESLQDLSKISSRTVCRSVSAWNKGGSGEGGTEETAQCAQGSRDIVTPFSLPFPHPKPPKSWRHVFVSALSSVWKFYLAHKLHLGQGGSLRMFRKRRVSRELSRTNDTSG